MLGYLNDLARLVTVGEVRGRMSTWPGRLAKAKVAGSNPVFRSKLPGIREVAVPGFFMGVALRGEVVGSHPSGAHPHNTRLSKRM